MKLALYAFFAGLVLGAAGGWKAQGWRWDAADKLAIEQANEMRRENNRAANTASAGHEADRQDIDRDFQTKTVEVIKIVERPIYRNVCLDPDGVQLLNAEIARDRPAAGKSGGTMPGADADH